MTIILNSCFLLYTFKDISISPDVKTYYVEDFQNNAFNSPATINITFSEALREKVKKETSLVYSETDPDINFSGYIQSYDVNSQAPSADGSSINRLQITLKIVYTNTKHENENWEKSFSHYADFAADSNLNEIQDQLITEIFNYILDEIINSSFNNW